MSASSSRLGRLGEELGPVVAGFLLDAVDFATYGPLGLFAGMLLGGLLGWWLAPSLGVRPAHRALCALIAGAYCTLPGTALLPLGTLFGFLVKLRALARPEPPPDRVVEAGAPSRDPRAGDSAHDG